MSNVGRHTQHFLGGEDLMRPNHQTPFPSDGSLVVGVHEFLKQSGVKLSAETIGKLVNVAFWASLRTEEGVTAPIAIAYESESKRNDTVFKLESPVDFSVEALVKLSPIIRDGKALLTISKSSKGQLEIDGICTSRDFPDFAIRSNSPGGISITAKEKIVADVIPGRRPRVRVFQSINSFDNIMHDLLLESTLFEDGQKDMAEIVLYHLCKAMLHGHGGTLLIVPSSSSAWQKSISFKYKISDNSRGISASAHQWLKEATGGVIYKGLPVLPENSADENHIMLMSNTIGAIAAVDGATVIDSNYGLLGFGAKITIPEPFAGTISWAEPMLNDSKEIKILDAGGMRHRSGIQFVSDNPGCIAIVASQDGRLTFFQMSDENTVEAESLEALFNL